MNQSVSKAGFFPRLSAFLVDSCILGILIMCLKMPVAFFELLYPDMFIFKGILFHFNIFDIFFYLLTVAYFVLFTKITGTTIGKRLFNLAVVDSEGNKLTFLNALYRETVGKYLSNILYFGYIMIFIDKNNRAFHDYLCDSFVIYTCTMRVVKKEKPAYSAHPQGRPDMNSANLYVENYMPQSSQEAEAMGNSFVYSGQGSMNADNAGMENTSVYSQQGSMNADNAGMENTSVYSQQGSMNADNAGMSNSPIYSSQEFTTENNFGMPNMQQETVNNWNSTDKNVQ